MSCFWLISRLHATRRDIQKSVMGMKWPCRASISSPALPEKYNNPSRSALPDQTTGSSIMRQLSTTLLLSCSLSDLPDSSFAPHSSTLPSVVKSLMYPTRVCFVAPTFFLHVTTWTVRMRSPNFSVNLRGTALMYAVPCETFDS